jgi:hypothetical protein
VAPDLLEENHDADEVHNVAGQPETVEDRHGGVGARASQLLSFASPCPADHHSRGDQQQQKDDDDDDDEEEGAASAECV